MMVESLFPNIFLPLDSHVGAHGEFGRIIPAKIRIPKSLKFTNPRQGHGGGFGKDDLPKRSSG